MRKAIILISAALLLCSCRIEEPNRNKVDARRLTQTAIEELELQICNNVQVLYGTIMINEYNALEGNEMSKELKSFMEYTYRHDSSGTYVHSGFGTIELGRWHKNGPGSYDYNKIEATDLGQGENNSHLISVSADLQQGYYNSSCSLKTLGKLVFEISPSGEFKLSGNVHFDFWYGSEKADWVELSYLDGEYKSNTSRD